MTEQALEAAAASATQFLRGLASRRVPATAGAGELAATSSTVAAAGPSTNRPAFWSQAAASQSAARAAGRLPPTTNPK